MRLRVTIYGSLAAATIIAQIGLGLFQYKHYTWALTCAVLCAAEVIEAGVAGALRAYRRDKQDGDNS